jgi:homoserine kinase type II
LENYQKNLHAEILESLNFLESAWRFDLPAAATHLDLFPDNVFFNENKKLSGVIDFYFSANEALVYDFAVAVNAWCFDEKNNFSEEKFLAIKQAYEEIRKFSEAEEKFLKIALIGAAMRFLLTRLHDMFFTPRNSLVKIKNPQEYLGKLKFFRARS